MAEPRWSGLSTDTKSRHQREKNNGIRNDANGWFADPRDLVTAIERIIHVILN